MTTLITITTLSILLSAFLLFKKPHSRFPEKYLTIIHFTSLGLVILTIVLLFQGYKLIGQYTSSIIGLLFLSTGILLFGLTTLKGKKLYCSIIAIPTLLINISWFIGGSPLLVPALIFYSMFAPPKVKEKVNENYNIEIHQGVILAPPNLFYLTKRTFGIFEERIRIISPEHFADISRIEIISFKENESLVCKIYSAGLLNSYSIDTLKYNR